MERVLCLPMTMSNLTNLRMRARMTKALILMKPHYKAKIRPIIQSCLLDTRSFGTGTSANSASSMSMPYQVGHCASLRMSERMSWSD